MWLLSATLSVVTGALSGIGRNRRRIEWRVRPAVEADPERRVAEPGHCVERRAVHDLLLGTASVGWRGWGHRAQV
jgi:hypothetical protein